MEGEEWGHYQGASRVDAGGAGAGVAEEGGFVEAEEAGAVHVGSRGVRLVLSLGNNGLEVGWMVQSGLLRWWRACTA